MATCQTCWCTVTDANLSKHTERCNRVVVQLRPEDLPPLPEDLAPPSVPDEA